MSSNVTLNGVQYVVPAYNDTGWAQGAGNLSLYLAAIASATLQPTGGAFTLTADVDFGSNFGLKALFLKTETANPASAGVIRLASADTIKWRNNANGADIALSKDASDNLQYNATKVLLSGAVVNADINAAAAIARSKLDFGSGLVNSDIAAAAAIAVNKLAALTVSRAMVTDASGFASASAVTATELGYVSGVTSAIQTQLNATIANPLTANLAAGAHKITGLAAGTANGDSVRFEDVIGSVLTAYAQADGGITSSDTILTALQKCGAHRIRQAPIIATSTTAKTSTSASYVDTNLTGSITPTATTSKILILACSNINVATTNKNIDVTFARGGTNLLAAGGVGGDIFTVSGGSTTWSWAGMYLDAPASVSSLAYSVQIKSDGSTTTSFGQSGTQILILIEIGV